LNTILDGQDHAVSSWVLAAQELNRQTDAIGRAVRVAASKANSALRAGKSVNMQDLRRDLGSAATAFAEAAKILADWNGSVQEFRLGSVLEADYDRILRVECAKLNVPLEGEYPVYEVFPFEVRVSLPDEQVTINRRTFRSLNPPVVAAEVRRELDRLTRGSFNSERFLRALIRVYDLLVAEAARSKGGRAPSQVRLKKVHETLTLHRGKAQYSEREFAFDIYRARRGSTLVADGRLVDFVHVRDAVGAIQVPSSRGAEYLGSLEVREVSQP
jgi:hypothetical protein